jgi:hypothetical protein
VSYELTEIAVDGIISLLKANLPTELAAVAVARGDGLVNLMPPQEYFIFETVRVMRKPAVFVMAENLDFELLKGQNHINAVHGINVAVTLEDRTEELLVRAAWRYQAALAKVLHQTQVVSSGGTKMVLKVESVQYSPVYSEDTKEDSRGVFCKEVLLNLSVNHFEPL